VAVVVTGSAGFIGSHLVERLVASGQEVVGIDRRAGTPACAAHEAIADLATCRLAGIVGDVLREADAVFHLAGWPGVRGGGGDLDRQRHRDNVVGGDRLLEWVDPEVPVVVASSSSVYGGAIHNGRLRARRESDPLAPRGAYACSKVELERRCRARAARGGLVSIARPFTVAGERQRADMAISRWLEAAAAGQPVRVFGGLDRSRDVTDVRDVVEGLARMAVREIAGVVNLGSGTSRRLGEILEVIFAVLGRDTEVVVEAAASEEASHTLADTSRFRRLLEVEPSTDLVSIVRRQAIAAGHRVPVSAEEVV
jgi:nucleoside-diphosphate-sugar epimerase